MTKLIDNIRIVKEKCVRLGKEKVPRATIYFFLSILFTLGYDFGFTVFLKPKLHKIAKIYCIAIFTAISILLFYTMHNVGLSFSLVYFLYMLQYAAHFFCVQYVKYNICNLITDLHTIDAIIPINNRKKIGTIAFIYTFILFWTKLGGSLYCVCYLRYSCPWNFILSWVPCYALDVITVVQILASFYISRAIHCLHKTLQTKSLKETVILYKYIVDCDSKIKPMLSQIMCVEIIILVPKIIGSLLIVVGYFTKRPIYFFEVELDAVINNLIHLFHALTPIFIPTIMVEMTKSRVLLIKQELSRRLLNEKDTKCKHDMISFLAYIDGRPLGTAAWNVLPFDVHLPLIILNGTSIFLIFTIQYFHLL